MLDKFRPYLNEGDLIEKVVGANGRDTYLMPSRRNAGHLAIALIREVVAPTVFRNAEEEITDIEDREGIRRVRATPSKFKFGERGRGLLVLRAWNVGGRLPQNRTAVGNAMPVGEAFDLNTLVFGDSAMRGTQVLPVKAAVQYSDALSAVPYRDAVGESFHHRGDETGTLWDAEGKKNSENLFTRHFVTPGTLLIQILTSNGRQLPPIGLDHLLLSLGLAGSYGGQTSVTGVNVRTHVAGVFASRFESPIASPYELLRALGDSQTSAGELASAIVQAMGAEYQTYANTEEASAHQRQLVDSFERDAPELRQRYEEAAPRIADLFKQHFTPSKA
ncbi:MAG: type I-D CRISPR-associated protein Csc2 [Gemmatimonadetes bacterium]|nr:type I-D CRISPR-associated protein Csc2 [Gemmatimonadota bacterium]